MPHILTSVLLSIFFLLLTSHRLICVISRLIEAAHNYSHSVILVLIEPIGYRFQRHSRRLVLRVAVNTRGYSRKRYAVQAFPFCKLQRIIVTVVKQLRIIGLPAVNGTDSMNDIARGEPVTVRYLRFTGLAAVKAEAFLQ